MAGCRHGANTHSCRAWQHRPPPNEMLLRLVYLDGICWSWPHLRAPPCICRCTAQYASRRNCAPGVPTAMLQLQPPRHQQSAAAAPAATAHCPACAAPAAPLQQTHHRSFRGALDTAGGACLTSLHMPASTISSFGTWTKSVVCVPKTPLVAAHSSGNVPLRTKTAGTPQLPVGRAVPVGGCASTRWPPARRCSASNSRWYATAGGLC
jgi:hypothetical protein